MHRTQINLEEWQVEALRTRARAEGRSMGALIREIVSQYLAPDLARRKELLDSIVVDVEPDDGPTDVAVNHDYYLYGAPKKWEPDQDDE